jgi:hypothetical protein
VTGDAPDDERSMLTGYLDWYGDGAEHELAGLTLDEATRASTPTGGTMLRALNHRARVEKRRIEHHFRGKDAEGLDARRSLVLGVADAAESDGGRYRDACVAARPIVTEQPSLSGLPNELHV